MATGKLIVSAEDDDKDDELMGELAAGAVAAEAAEDAHEVFEQLEPLELLLEEDEVDESRESLFDFLRLPSESLEVFFERFRF